MLAGPVALGDHSTSKNAPKPETTLLLNNTVVFTCVLK